MNKVSVDGLPIGQIMGQESPLATSATEVEHGVEQFSTLILGRTATCGSITLNGGDEIGNQIPFIIREIGIIALAQKRPVL